MKLNDKNLSCSCWAEKGYKIPSFDRAKMIENTKKNPQWVHFGAGNIFRIFPAHLAQILIESGKMDTGIVVGEGFDYEIISKAYHPFDNLTLMVTLKADGSIDKEVIASVAESHPCAKEFQSSWERFIEVFENPSLQMVSFTITEKGYALKNAKGELFSAYAEDFEDGPGKGVRMLFSRLAYLLLKRYEKGAYPIALVSMDNCSHNGEKVENAVKTIANAWLERGFVDKGFIDYLSSENVSYPWSMIDKITPRPDASVASMLEKDGFEDTDVIITDKKTYTAAFVNAEECQYLVIEDKFPNGRPSLEDAGVYFTTRETVNKVEKMKVCTCLNPLHTALAVNGCLLSYHLISEEMKDEDLVALIKRIGYTEGLPVVVNPGIIDPKKFIAEVINVRLPNPFMPDSPERIATDTSQKLPIRFGETIKAYITAGKDVKSLKGIAYVFASWMRYTMALDDNLESFTPSPDPLLEYAQAELSCLEIGKKVSLRDIEKMLRNKDIFGVDLIKAGLADTVVEYLNMLLEGKGSVRKTLHSLVK